MMSKELEISLIYFYIHFVCEVVCFYYLGSIFEYGIVLWIAYFIYDALAFVPQSLFGYIADNNKNIYLGLIGTLLLIVSTIVFSLNQESLGLVALVLLSLGNALIHVDGAQATLRTSSGYMTPVSIFVSGGSFGVVTGKLLCQYKAPYLLVLFLLITTIPFIIYGNVLKEYKDCIEYNYVNKNVNPYIAVISAFVVVLVRSYVGYGIPTTWKKNILETILFYSSMGIGKALGGILVDKIGVKKTSVISILCSVPFLIFGDNIIIVSLIGICLFSMSMSVSLALIISIIPKKPGLAFGVTTIGLFVGAIPIFFIKIKSMIVNCLMIIIVSIMCYVLIRRVIIKEGLNDTSSSA